MVNNSTKSKLKIDSLLNGLSSDYFELSNLNYLIKREILSRVKRNILINRVKLEDSIVNEIKLTRKDAIKEVDRAYKTFALAEKNCNFLAVKKIVSNGRTIVEKRIARGPILAITPYSSPLSSPAHKISLGILAGTSVLFKPSPLAEKTGRILFDIINKATKGKYVYFYSGKNIKELQTIISDDRIGIISFTGGYETAKNIIKTGGVKRYHMELSGGNSPVVFSPDFNSYNNQLVEKIIEGVISKNGQRCVSIKHIFIPIKHKKIISIIQNKLDLLKNEIKKDFASNSQVILGPLVTIEHAINTENKIKEILNFSKEILPVITLERNNDFLFPTMYSVNNLSQELIRKLLSYDLSGPVLFIYFYKDEKEYELILNSLKKDYIQSGLQLSIFTNNLKSIEDISKNLIWGGIIVNDIPTFRDEFMSFGGFGRAGLGKEGFFETLNQYTDPQVLVINK